MTRPSALSFKNLQHLDLRTEEARQAKIPLGPAGLAHGKLDNGLTYYVRKNARPKERGALALAVNVGSVLETEEERGVAHIVEHLAFSATTKYSNHELVKFLESVGAEFGACQNAYTTADETVYELFIPTDKPGLLEEALSVFAEFSTEIRISEEDLNKERGPVLEEMRERRNAVGRMQEAYWKTLMQGSLYAERQPIGLEKVIRNVSASTVKAFYRRWYRPEHMAVVVVGDFGDTEEVVATIKDLFGYKKPAIEGPPPTIPVCGFTPHEDFRVSAFVDSEAGSSAVIMTCKLPSQAFTTVEGYRRYLAHEMFHMVLNQRFFRLSRKQDPPFCQCESGSQALARTVESVMISAVVLEGGILTALEAVLTELARIRLHGLTEREVGMVRALYMADMERNYLERDQMMSDSFRAEYVQHFLVQEPVPGIEYEVQLTKTLLPEISLEELQNFAGYYSVKNSCVIKTVDFKKRTSEEHIRAVVAKVQDLEERRAIPSFAEENPVPELVKIRPQPGSVVQSKEYPVLEAKEIVLSNGLRVVYKATEHRDDQILISGYAYGGLSEVDPKDYHSCSMGQAIAAEMGQFGVKPVEMMEIMAGKRADVAANIGAYQRSFAGECSPTDLEVCLQLVYQLFVTSVEPRDDELRVLKQMAREAIKAQLRDPFTSYVNKVRSLNYGDSYYFKPITESELNKVDPKKACQYFDESFKDPSAFTVSIVGTLEEDSALALICQYLGGIPKPPKPVRVFAREALTALPFKFPDGVIRQEVKQVMTEAQCQAQLTFPINLPPQDVTREVFWCAFVCMLLETKVMQCLRFKHGQVYTVSVSPYLGGSKPSKSGGVRGDLAISFSCDPEEVWDVVDLALSEVERLQEVGPTEEDVATMLELEQRSYENGLQENPYWRDAILRAYQSRLFDGDADASFQAYENSRKGVIAECSSATCRAALQRILPVPCRSQHTAVVLMPQAPLWQRLFKFGSSWEGKAVLMAGLACVAFLIWRRRRK